MAKQVGSSAVDVAGGNGFENRFPLVHVAGHRALKVRKKPWGASLLAMADITADRVLDQVDTAG
ncbi:hypothetical protein [Pseudomonas fluorescens]|uniref:hypothetical protein n=1 Tax=Pseudomonas fluorescens TaxID=294 RepID=UPI00177C621D|nr:hypothetical protein [Pseudomonas fluorescens]